MSLQFCHLSSNLVPGGSANALSLALEQVSIRQERLRTDVTHVVDLALQSSRVGSYGGGDDQHGERKLEQCTHHKAPTLQ